MIPWGGTFAYAEMKKNRLAFLMFAAALMCASCAALADGDVVLRGFRRVKAEREAGEVSVMRFICEDEAGAEAVAGKFLMDLASEDGVAFTGGIHLTKGGAAFAVERDGRRTAVYAAENGDALESFLKRKAGGNAAALKGRLVEKAKCPEYMKAFRWGTYGIGGLEEFHNWMRHAKRIAGVDPKTDKTPLDPREDYAFLREMGNIHFDNWLQLESFDNSDGIISSLVYSRKKLAEDFGIPIAYRVYMPSGGTGSYTWYTRRFAGRADKPAKWMQNGWLRYFMHSVHQSWYDEDAWGYTAARTQDAMRRVRSGNERTWMHPAGELVHQPWYDWHADYSDAAAKSWREYISKRMTLKDAAAAYNHPSRPFASWSEVPVPEFATFAGLDGMVLDLWGDWQTSTNGVNWTPLPDFPGNWDFLGLYTKPGGGIDSALADGRRPEQKSLFRRFRRTFTWRRTAAGGPRTYLYFFPMSGATLRHEVTLNGGGTHKVGNWCAIDVTDELADGENVLDILLQGSIWNGRVFLSAERPEVYPNMPEERCRLWSLWHQWRCDVKAERCEEVFDAMRQVEPNAPIEFMAPLRFGQRITDRLMHDWGAFAQFTGEGVWFFPWYKRYAKLYGYQGTSELAGPYDTVEKARTSALRVFLAGLDMHKPVFLVQTYSRNRPVRDWWISHRNLFARMGTYDIDLKQPQILVYRRTELTEGGFPEPFPVIDATVGKIRTPWNYDIGRGELQAIGQSFLYIDDDGIEDGKMNGFKVMFDCGNEIIPECEVERIKEWVEKGGVFVAYPFTGRSTPLRSNAWPMASFTGARIKPDEKIVRPGKVPKVTFPKETRTSPVVFPSFAGQTIHGAKRRLHELDFALETVSGDAKPILFWEDGRIAATARRVGKGMAVHLGSMFWRGSEDVKGMWNPQDVVESAFLRDLLAAVGQPAALVETDDRLVLAQPYRSKNGLELVAVLCNFNEEEAGHRETVVKLRTGRRPKRIVAYAGEGCLDAGLFRAEVRFDWDETAGVAVMRLSLAPQEVAILEAQCYSSGDALAHWWNETQEQWHEIKKPTRDFSKYREGEWKDPTQDLKEGWSLLSGSHSSSAIPLDCLQFWGWPEGKGALCRREFDLDEAGWLADGGATRLVVGSWAGPNFLSPATIRLNGETLASGTKAGYLDFDVSEKLRAKGNALEVEFADGGKFTGMNGAVYLYHRARPEKSIWIKGGSGRPCGSASLSEENGRGTISLFVPREWYGRHRVRLYMEGAGKVPKGVRVRDRFMRKHHHNFGNLTDIDITELLEFGATNRVDLGANSPAEHHDHTSSVPLTILRLDLYPANNMLAR